MSILKKYFRYILAFIIIIFIIPALCTKQTRTTVADVEDNKLIEENQTKYDYKKFSKIKLLDKVILLLSGLFKDKCFFDFL